MKDAYACFHEAILIDPNYAEAYCNLGLALATEGQITQAEAAVRQALRVKPGYRRALETLELPGKK
jgi:protein O-GlcNAc transferase